MPRTYGDHGFAMMSTDGATGGAGRRVGEGASKRAELDPDNLRLRDACDRVLRLAEEVYAAGLTPEEQISRLRPAFRDFMREADPVLRASVRARYNKCVTNPAERDKYFAERTVALFLDEKLPSRGKPSLKLIQKLADDKNKNPRGYLWRAAEFYTNDRLDALGIVREEPTDPGSGRGGAGAGQPGSTDELEDRELQRRFEECPVERMHSILDGLRWEDRILIQVIHLEHGMLGDDDIEALAEKRDVPVQQVREELEARYRARSATRQQKEEYLNQRQDGWYEKLLRFQGKKNEVLRIFQDLECTYDEADLGLGNRPIDPELIGRLRDRTSRLLGLPPALRWRCCQALLEDLARQIGRLSAKLSKQVRVLPDWEEVAIIIGEVEAGASPKKRSTAANTVTKRHLHLRRHLAAAWKARLEAEATSGT